MPERSRCPLTSRAPVGPPSPPKGRRAEKSATLSARSRGDYAVFCADPGRGRLARFPAALRPLAMRSPMPRGYCDLDDLAWSPGRSMPAARTAGAVVLVDSEWSGGHQPRPAAPPVICTLREPRRRARGAPSNHPQPAVDYACASRRSVVAIAMPRRRCSTFEMLAVERAGPALILRLSVGLSAAEARALAGFGRGLLFVTLKGRRRSALPPPRSTAVGDRRDEPVLSSSHRDDGPAGLSPAALTSLRPRSLVGAPPSGDGAGRGRALLCGNRSSVRSPNIGALAAQGRGAGNGRPLYGSDPALRHFAARR